MGTPTWQQLLYYTAHLLTLSPHISSNYFASQQLSPHSALAKRPFSGPQPSTAIHWTTPTTLLANQWQSSQTSRSTGKKVSFQATANIQRSLQNDYTSLDYISEGSNQSAKHQKSNIVRPHTARHCHGAQRLRSCGAALCQP